MPTTEWERKHRPTPGTHSAEVLRTAQTIAAHRRLTMLAELFGATAAALDATPNPGRWGIPAEMVARDTSEALRWSPVVVHTVALAERVVASARLADGSVATDWLEGAVT